MTTIGGKRDAVGRELHPAPVRAAQLLPVGLHDHALLRLRAGMAVQDSARLPARQVHDDQRALRAGIGEGARPSGLRRTSLM